MCYIYAVYMHQLKANGHNSNSQLFTHQFGYSCPTFSASKDLNYDIKSVTVNDQLIVHNLTLEVIPYIPYYNYIYIVH